jgi:nicotinamide mononucleotide transporter
MFELFADQAKQQSSIEVVAVVLALAYVWLAAKQHIACWLCAFLSTAIYSYIFWEVTLPFQAALNLYYMAVAFYGWRQWQHKDALHLPVLNWSLNKHILCISSLAVVTLLLVLLTEHWFDNSYVYLDAGVTVFSVFATLLVANKVRENWLYWIVIDVLAAYLYYANGLLLTATLFAVYAVFAIYGYQQWGKQKSVCAVLRAE